MKRTFLAVILMIGAVFSAYGQNTSPVDVILLLDTSSGMSSSYENVTGYITGAFLNEFLRIGDTFHLIAFSGRPRLDVARRISGIGDVETIIGRMLLQYPVENESNVREAISFTEQYITTLPTRPKKIVVVGTVDSDTNSVVSAARQRLSSINTTIDFVQVTPGQRLTNLPSSGRPAAARTPAATAPTVTAPTVTAPTVTAPTVTAPTVTAPTVTAPVATAPATQPSVGTTAPSTPAATTPAGTTPPATTPTVTPAVTAPVVTTTVTQPSETTTPSTMTPATTPTAATDPSDDTTPSTVTTTVTTDATGQIIETTDFPHTEHGEETFDTTINEIAGSDTLTETTERQDTRRRSERNNNTGESVLSSLPFIIGIIVLILLLLALIIFLASRRLGKSPNRVMSQAASARYEPQDKFVDHSKDLASYAAVQTRQRVTPYDARPAKTEYFKPVEINPSGPLVLNIHVEEQNTAIGKRNIHSLKSGYSLSVGGGKSDDYLIFLVPMPAHIGEIKRSGSALTFIPRKPKYFPDIGSTEVKDCINKTIRVVSDKNYEVRFRFEMYEDPLIALNRILMSIKVPG